MRTAWLALLLLGSISAVAAMLAGTWRAPAAADATPGQTAAMVEPVDDTALKTPNWPEAAARQEVAARQAVDPDPSPSLRGAELPATPFPAAPEMNANASTNIMSRHWHDASTVAKMPVASPQQIKKMRDSKAELRAKRSKAAANTRACAPPSNGLASLFRKLSLTPSCTI